MDTDKDTKWFEKWFNSPYYHTLYKNRGSNEAEFFINNIINYLKPAADARFLDLACGKGRHSVFLNAKGYDVTGIDLSRESIKHAAAFENEKLHFYVHDMRKLLRTNYFDYILNLFTSFGYFEHDRDELAAVHAAAAALKPGSILIIDFFNAHKIISTLQAKEEKLVDGIKFTINKKLEEGFIIKEILFSDKGKDFKFEERVKALSLENFEKYFAACGLNITNLWGDYSLNKFDITASDRLIIGVKKQ